ncbi:MAG: MFS transporter [Blastocatellia bacterium]|nr:MFS transporter [Blastocatellia bacterium]
MSQTSTRAYGLLAFLTLLNIFNFVDRQLISSLGPLLIKDLGLNRAQIGLLSGYVFLIFYTLMGLGLGTVADRTNRPRLIAVGLTLWSALTAASGLAQGFYSLATARMLVGVGEATLSPAALSMLYDVFPAIRRGFATGVYYAGVPLGAGLSLVVSGWLAPRYGWRFSFFALGLVGLVLVGLVLLLQDPRRGGMEVNLSEPKSKESQKPTTGEIMRELGKALQTAPTLLLTIAGGVTLTFAAAAGNLLITWLVEERGFDFRRAAYTAGLIFATGGLCGNIFGGWFADWCQSRFSGGRLWSLVIQSLVFSPLGFAFFTVAPDSVFFYVAWFFTSFGGSCWYGPLYAITQDLTPVKIRSTMIAFVTLTVSCLGTGAGPWVVGMIGDVKSLSLGLKISALVPLLGIIPFALGALRFERDFQRTKGQLHS